MTVGLIYFIDTIDRHVLHNEAIRSTGTKIIETSNASSIKKCQDQPCNVFDSILFHLLILKRQQLIILFKDFMRLRLHLDIAM